jgi:hypothetical protein
VRPLVPALSPAYEHVAELLAERGVEVDPSCIWRWVQAFAPELNKHCLPHLKPTNKSYRTDDIANSSAGAKGKGLRFTLHLLGTLRYDLVDEAMFGELHALRFARWIVARMFE